MLFSVLIIPAMMIISGLFLWKLPPSQPNGIIGYRSAYSLKNKDTWAFAQENSGKRSVRVGAAMLALSVAAALSLSGAGLSASGTISIVFMTIQLLILLASFIPTEVALRRTFDENGNRK